MSENVKSIIRIIIEAVVVALTAVLSVFFSSSCAFSNSGTVDTRPSVQVEVTPENFWNYDALNMEQF